MTLEEKLFTEYFFKMLKKTLWKITTIGEKDWIQLSIAKISENLYSMYIERESVKKNY